MSTESMIAPCGIDCAQCEIYKAAHNSDFAEQLAKQWRESWQPKAQPDWFKCQGCRGDRTDCWSSDCTIHACCVAQKSLDSCSQCPDFPCKQLQEWAAQYPNHTEAFERLQQMRGQKRA